MKRFSFLFGIKVEVLLALVAVVRMKLNMLLNFVLYALLTWYVLTHHLASQQHLIASTSRSGTARHSSTTVRDAVNWFVYCANLQILFCSFGL